MTKLLFHFTVLLFSFGCSNSGSDKAASKPESDSAIILDKAAIPTTKNIADVSTTLDSIDKANSNTIATDDENYIQKATVSKVDSLIWLTANMKLDHRIFAYNKPDTTSQKTLLLSIFTNDVKGNPFNCPFGSYYQTSDMTDMKLKYISTVGNFIKVNIFKKDTIQGTIYIGKKWIEFEE